MALGQQMLAEFAVAPLTRLPIHDAVDGRNSQSHHGERDRMSDAGQTVTSKAGAYRVLARKYRPRDFSGLIGQEPMVRTLTNAFSTGRIAQAWMLTGVRGVGKTTTARILARALNYRTATGTSRPSIFPKPASIAKRFSKGVMWT